MGIKLYGSPYSPAAQRVLLVLSEKDLEYEQIIVDLRSGEQKKEPFISINPFGQVPGLEDGDLKVFESRAITKYLSYAYGEKGNPLLSQEAKKAAIIAVWMEVESLRFEAVAGKLHFEVVVKPLKGLIPDEAVAEQLQEQLAKLLDVYEGRLKESKYLGGDSYTLADLHHIPIINSLSKTKYKVVFDERPHVAAWCADILSRPASQKIIGGPKV